MTKYIEFQEKREMIKEYGIFHHRDVSQKYYDLLEEVLEEFKKLEDNLNLNWRMKVEAETKEERQKAREEINLDTTYIRSQQCLTRLKRF